MKLSSFSPILTFALCAVWLQGAPVALAARSERLELRHVTLDLPGPPAKVVPTDVDGDGRTDLVVVVAFTAIEQISEDRVEDMIQISRVIPTLFDRREARVYLATAEGGYAAAGAPLELPETVLHLEVGPPGIGLLALTDDGLSALRYTDGNDGGTLRLETLIDHPPVLARTGSFYPTLELVHDLDGDGDGDVLLPAPEGLAVYLATDSGLTAEPTDLLQAPSEEQRAGDRTRLRYPLPEVREINGDGYPDLLFGSGAGPGPAPLHVYLGSGDGRFVPLRSVAEDCLDNLTDVRVAEPAPDASPWPRDLAMLRDLDGDGRAEAVMSVARSRGDSMRKEIKDAKRPIQDFRFHRLRDDLAIEPEPYFETEVVGHTMEGGLEGDEEVPFSLEQFVDLDGDGREDLVTITLNFSVLQALRIMATKRISIGVDFHVYAQHADGHFREVPGLDLSEKLKFDLNDLKLGRFAQFAGDFDGNGRHDFVHLGRGSSITIHTGQPGCRYPQRPDLTIELEEEPAGLDLVRIEDLDGDGRSDLRITRPLASTDPDVTAPVRLDLYLSGSAE